MGGIKNLSLYLTTPFGYALLPRGLVDPLYLLFLNDEEGQLKYQHYIVFLIKGIIRNGLRFFLLWSLAKTVENSFNCRDIQIFNFEQENNSIPMYQEFQICSVFFALHCFLEGDKQRLRLLR